MQNLNEHAKTKPKPKTNSHAAVRTAHMCVRIIVHNCRTLSTAQNSSDNFPLILPTVVIAQMMPILESRGRQRQMLN